MSPVNPQNAECEQMRVSGPAWGPSCEWRRAILCGTLFISFCATQTRGQDVAEAARQEKDRKAAEQKSPRHVYTEDDLKRQVILTPEDQARVEARKQQPTVVPGEQNAQQTPNGTEPLTESLGEIARRYRQEKAARETDLVEKKKITPFPYKVPDVSLAEPKLGVAPLAGPAVGPELNERNKPSVPNLAPLSSPRVSNSHKRISPFQPRPLYEAPSAPPLGLAVVPAPPRPARTANPIERTAPIAVAGAATRRVEVQRGQSWWKLAQLYLGSGARWPELRQLNADTGGPPELLRLGSLVVVPEGAKAAEGSMPGTVKVRKGNSLWSLAHEYLGRGSGWTCLASANPAIVDYTHLAIGTSVQLPQGALASCRSENAGNRPR
jgi:nucleoid-associated protein YgaU